MSIPAEEIAEVFRQALRGEIAVKVEGAKSWCDVYCGDVEFRFGDWRIAVFNDCSEFDYVSYAADPDGRTAEFNDWEADPVELLTFDELTAIETLVEGLVSEVKG